MIEYRRRGRRRFVSGDFTLLRPSGWKAGRAELELRRAGHDYNFRVADEQLWLLDGEREVGWACGGGVAWELVIGDLRLSIEQPTHGVNHSVVRFDAGAGAQIRASGFPIRSVELIGAGRLSEEQRAFVVAVALLGWRESDHAMITSRAGQ